MLDFHIMLLYICFTILYKMKPFSLIITKVTAFYSRHKYRVMLWRKIKQESEMLRKNSMKILGDFEDIEYV